MQPRAIGVIDQRRVEHEQRQHRSADGARRRTRTGERGVVRYPDIAFDPPQNDVVRHSFHVLLARVGVFARCPRRSLSGYI